jgi:hypothetical protein
LFQVSLSKVLFINVVSAPDVSISLRISLNI